MPSGNFIIGTIDLVIERETGTCPCGNETSGRCACGEFYCSECFRQHASAPDGRCRDVTEPGQTRKVEA